MGTVILLSDRKVAGYKQVLKAFKLCGLTGKMGSGISKTGRKGCRPTAHEEH